MFGKADDRSRLAQAAYTNYFNKHVRVMKRLNDGKMVFLDIPKHEPKTAKERD